MSILPTLWAFVYVWIFHQNFRWNSLQVVSFLGLVFWPLLSLRVQNNEQQPNYMEDRMEPFKWLNRFKATSKMSERRHRNVIRVQTVIIDKHTLDSWSVWKYNWKAEGYFRQSLNQINNIYCSSSHEKADKKQYKQMGTKLLSCEVYCSFSVSPLLNDRVTSIKTSHILISKMKAFGSMSFSVLASSKVPMIPRPSGEKREREA